MPVRHAAPGTPPGTPASAGNPSFRTARDAKWATAANVCRVNQYFSELAISSPGPEPGTQELCQEMGDRQAVGCLRTLVTTKWD